MDQLDRQSEAYKKKFIQYCCIEDQIEDQIKTLKEKGELSNNELGVLMRDLWIVKGFTQYGLNTSMLKEVASKYWKLGIVPQGYN